MLNTYLKNTHEYTVESNNTENTQIYLVHNLRATTPRPTIQDHFVWAKH